MLNSLTHSHLVSSVGVEHTSRGKEMPVRKTHTSPLGETSKKINFDFDAQMLKGDISSSCKASLTREDKEGIDKINQSSRFTEESSKSSKFSHFFRKEKQLPLKSQLLSPRSAQIGQSPFDINAYQSNGSVSAVRETLKALAQKGVGYFESGVMKDREQKSANTSFNANRLDGRMGSGMNSPRSMRIMQKENEILKEENEMLKNQLTEIKRQLMFGSSNKKEELISNLRNTIKKEDTENKELRMKLEIANKKVISLNGLLETKDEQIRMLSSKVYQLQSDTSQLRQRNAQKLQSLKQKINFVLKSYLQLQLKCSNGEIEWLRFQEKLLDEKSVYVNRIQFLEEYIAGHS